MDKVVIDGIEYVKAAAAAEQLNYTSDYVGQLCRAKKVDARLVGRTWFVHPESLKEHKNATHQKATESEEKNSQPDDLASNVKINRIDVNAPLKNKTVKSATFNSPDQTTPARLVNGTAPEITYHSDAETLLPNMNEKPPEVNENDNLVQPRVKRYLHIEPASAKKLKITNDKRKQVSFSTTELPDVALSGKLNVSTYRDIVHEPSGKPDPKETEAAVAHQAKSIEDSPVSMSIKHDTSVQQDSRVADVSKNAPPASLWIRIMPLLVTLLAVAISFLLLTIVSEIALTEGISTSNLSLRLENFWQLFAQ
jgi:hypothetical protein